MIIMCSKYLISKIYIILTTNRLRNDYFLMVYLFPEHKVETEFITYETSHTIFNVIDNTNEYLKSGY